MEEEEFRIRLSDAEQEALARSRAQEAREEAKALVFGDTGVVWRFSEYSSEAAYNSGEDPEVDMYFMSSEIPESFSGRGGFTTVLPMRVLRSSVEYQAAIDNQSLEG
ncbi:MAG: hypothetical protein QOF36_1311 [Microbacteriaceae bacterium]|nr:hypothetical protein [Microbacteriaceae bacterium]